MCSQIILGLLLLARVIAHLRARGRQAEDKTRTTTDHYSIF
jgi:hypothetical protein